jgi:hypothetical protein
MKESSKDPSAQENVRNDECGMKELRHLVLLLQSLLWGYDGMNT